MTSLESEANNRRNGMVFTFYWKGFHNVLRYIINEYIYEPDVKRNVIMYIFVKNVSQFIEMAKFCLGYDL